jgi:hypothetical protein
MLPILVPPMASAQRCDSYEPERQAFFGDVHVHSSYSFDGYLFETRNTPRDAYRFAMGESVGLGPLDANGDPTRTYQLRVPLDFAAVTDHAEMLGETRICTIGGLQIPACDALRDGPLGAAFFWFGDQFSSETPERRAFCGTDGAICLAQASTVWDEIQAAANDFDDPTTACEFSAFVGYEWTASPDNDNLHRNVLFRNSSVPPLPLSYVEVQEPPDLWGALQAQCATAGNGCEALTIPHNSNMSGGQTFLTTKPDGSPREFADAWLQQEMEPLVELVQHKGDSECRVGVGATDEACDFEKIPEGPPASDAPLSYVRNVLKAGLELDAQLGVNPFTLGMIASTDTHNGTPGATQEDDFPGHVRNVNATPESRLSGNILLDNPGGLMVLWAEENSRDALFDAMQRRESYATSGTRPELRFFGGLDLPADLCAAADVVGQGYANGVPMGGQLTASVEQPAPRFVVQASQDPGSPGFPGTRLAEIQIVKGWLDAEGVTHERVVTIEGGAPPPDAVGLLTCTPNGSGMSTLCGEWQDDDFDPDEYAFYYARVLESPSCRWSTHLCRAEGVDCTATPPPGFENCCNASVPETIQERATSSPIWVRPVPEPGFVHSLVPGLLMLAAATVRRRDSRRRDAVWLAGSFAKSARGQGPVAHADRDLDEARRLGPGRHHAPLQPLER